MEVTEPFPILRLFSIPYNLAWTTLKAGMWTLQSGALRSRDRTFSRALGFIELSFHWDGAFSGASDCILHQTVQFPKVSQNRITDESFRRAWLAAKGHFPILGAEIKERDSGKTVEFIVREANLAELGEREVVFLEGSAEVASQVVEDALNGPRKLSNNKLASLTVIRPEKDDDPTFHLVINIAHVITDGIGSSTLVRSLLEHLASCDQKPLLDLRERLAMAVCAESLTPTSHLNRARRRWRNAVAQILWENSQRALRGGHGLPGRFSPQTSTTPAQSKQVFVTLPSSLSQAIIQSCRANSITFGYAYPVIAQVALSRFLHRRYLQGQIPEKEWQYRLRQPTHTGGPLNLRPFLNEGWVAAGGEREMNIYVSFFRVTLPFMARPSSSVPATLDTSGAPPFASLLSIKRFFGRCALVKQKVLRFAQHPLFFEIISQREPLHSNRKRKAALHWRRLQAGKLSPIDFTAATAGIDDNVVFAHGGSSIGNVGPSSFISLSNSS